jgi:HK97 family phage portal protein
MLGTLLVRSAPPSRSGRTAQTSTGWVGWGNGAGTITEDSVRGLPPLAAGIRHIQSAIMQMPLGSYREDEQGVVTEVKPVPLVLRYPTPGPGRVVADFITEYVNDSVLYGNYVAQLGPNDSTGYPMTLLPWPVDEVELKAEASGRLTYKFNNELFDESEVFHVAHDCRTGELAGAGILRRFRDTLGATVGAEKHTSNYFGSGAVPPGVIYDSRPDLTQEQADLLKVKWRGMATLGEPVVLPEPTTKFVPLVTDADKAQLVEARQWNASLVAMMLPIHPSLLGLEGPSMTYSNMESESLRFIKTTVMRLLVPLEQQFSRQCIPSTQRVMFDPTALLRPDSKTRFETYKLGLDGGWLTVDEVREREGLPPMEEEGLDEEMRTLIAQEAR